MPAKRPRDFNQLAHQIMLESTGLVQPFQPEQPTKNPAAVALHYMHYNFCRIHQALRVTPAMEAGVTDHLWSMQELIALLQPSGRPGFPAN
jgi:hypothetical protein